MTISVIFALQTARIQNSSNAAVTRVQRARFAVATGRQEGDSLPSLLVNHSTLYFEREKPGRKPSADQQSHVGGFGAPRNGIYAGYKALKILHD